MTRERWAPIPGWEGWYEVSDRARVRSLPRTLSDGRQHGGGILRQRIGTRGYWVVTLSGQGKRQTVLVHVIVMAAFAGAPPAGMEVCHGPGGRLNDHLRNLRYDTHSENERDKRRTPQAWRRFLSQTETGFTTADGAYRGSAVVAQPGSETLRPAETSVTSLDDTGADTGPETGTGGRR